MAFLSTQDSKNGSQKTKKVILKIENSDVLRFLDFRYVAVRLKARVKNFDYDSREDLHIINLLADNESDPPKSVETWRKQMSQRKNSI